MCKIARVLIASAAQQLDRLFDYAIPEVLVSEIEIGTRVIVPFQNRPNLGYVWELAAESEFDVLKSVSKVLDNPPLISPVQYQLVEWLARFYLCSRVDVIKLCLPPRTNPTGKNSYCFNENWEQTTQLLEQHFDSTQTASILAILKSAINQQWNEKKWQQKLQVFPKVWNLLLQHQLLTKNYQLTNTTTKSKIVKYLKWTAAVDLKETDAGARVKDALLAAAEIGLTRSELAAAASVSDSVINRLLKEAKITCFDQIKERIPLGFDEVSTGKPVVFNAEQNAIYQTINAKTDIRFFLLQGVTGSGKTEIYFELASDALKQGKQVLYLVPEIALTPQTLERARFRFGDQVALLHSNMSDGERFDQWLRVKNGRARFVLGARSAVFAPFTNLGWIIVDEEHETTYKQEETPRYHTREVVEKLAELTGARVIFGSATPSVESFYKTTQKKYEHLYLKQRFNNRPLPEVNVVDMREELKAGNRNILSRTLAQGIETALANQEQVILLLNRRGHSTFVICRDCGQSLQCPSCEVSLTYHATETVLRCHYCDHRQKIPDTCPNCRSIRIRYFGNGTQKLEAELQTSYPGANIIRMDLDSTARKGAHHQIYRQLTHGAVDILLGTQMIAKGLDLPRVTLVGVISADSTLNMPDFRAAERCFHLLTQVAGRAGRGEKSGRVIFQTYNPEHYALNFAKNHDFAGFYETEIANRASLQYPPFSEFVKFGFSGLDETKVQKAATYLAEICEKIKFELVTEETADFLEILGPVPALITKLQNKYRWQVLLKSNNWQWLELVPQKVWEAYSFRKFPDVRVIRDRNPYSIL